ncbi:MAG TPA: hypothetical protein VN915_05550 [Elusimicrobiota bacterium]|nr:hypothetical protein [Elusimicrobiota bacterium]
MIERHLSSLKTVVVGALAGVVTFLALNAVRAQTVLTVEQLRGNPKAYVGNGEVAITGIAKYIRSETRKYNGQVVPVIKLSLYERDKKGNAGSHYVFCVVPASQFSTTPVEGGMVTITGPLKWPYEIAAIDP